MRFFILLLGTYMTFLALMPCQDRDDMAFKGAYQTSVQKSHSATEQNNRETCSPFCTCNCCSTARQLTLTTSSTALISSSAPDYPAYRIPAIKDQSIPIWEPPQIA